METATANDQAERLITARYLLDSIYIKSILAFFEKKRVFSSQIKQVINLKKTPSKFC